MKCKKCERPAVINMHRHRLALCESCYLEWFPAQVEKTIQRFGMFERGDRLIVAVSGGKDSLGLWDVLLRLGYRADGVYIHLGIHQLDYSATSLAKIEAFIAARAAEGIALDLHIVDILGVYGESIPGLVAQRRGRKPCSVCGLIKRHEMNRLAYERGYSVLVTGHNLDDEAATLFSNVLRWQTGYLGRQGPVLPSLHPKLVRKAKPYCLTYERESAAYTLLRGLEYIYDECPYSVQSKTIFYKELLNRLESRSPGAKLGFYQSFLQARAEGRVSCEEMVPPTFHECTACGQPTTVPGLCAFCRLWATQPKADLAEEYL